MSSAEKPSFKVIIVGGSVSGLALAHSLSRAGIDYVLLEAGADPAPDAGASIGISPNGGRVLDQLGVFDDIEAKTNPIKWVYSRDKDGVVFNSSDLPQFLDKRLGYPTVFLGRQSLLRVLFDHLKEKHKYHLNKRVVKIEHSEKGVKVLTKDGSEYAGDMVVGVDGVHSIVRSEMWRHADIMKPGFITQEEKTAMTVEYCCIFGISSRTPGLDEGNFNINFNDMSSALSAVGKDGQVYWFVYIKLDKKYVYPDCPRFTKADAEKYAEGFRDSKILETTTFGQVWDNCVSYAMTSLEENVFETWNFGRIVCLGDSIHKMTPNLGQGGNTAIESAAALANSIHKLIYKDKNPKPTTAELDTYLQDFSKSRKPRVNVIFDSSALSTRTQARDGLLNIIMTEYMFKILDDVFLNLSCDLVVGAVKLNYLPLPERSINGWMPFDENLGATRKPILSKRAKEASVFLVLFGVASYLIWTGQNVNGTTEMLQQAISAGRWETENGVVSIKDVYFGVPAVDAFLQRLIIRLSPSVLELDHTQRLQMISSVAELIPVHTIWAIEAWRSGNYLTSANLALPFALAYQRYGFGVVAPLYYFFHYVLTSYQNYASIDLRVINSNYARTILPTTLISLALPAILMFGPFDFSSDTRQAFAVLWQLFPITFAILHRALTKLVPDNTVAEKMTPGVDIPILRRTYISVGVISALVHLYIRSFSLSGYEVFFAGVRDPFSTVESAVYGIGQAAKLNYLIGFGSSLLWAVMTLNDLKRFGRTSVSLVRMVLGMVLGTVVFGPGAVLAAFWMWREDIISRRRSGREGHVLQ